MGADGRTSATTQGPLPDNAGGANAAPTAPESNAGPAAASATYNRIPNACPRWSAGRWQPIPTGNSQRAEVILLRWTFRDFACHEAFWLEALLKCRCPCCAIPVCDHHRWRTFVFDLAMAIVQKKRPLETEGPKRSRSYHAMFDVPRRRARCLRSPERTI